jgi:hypothetical protein
VAFADRRPLYPTFANHVLQQLLPQNKVLLDINRSDDQSIPDVLGFSRLFPLYRLLIFNDWYDFCFEDLFSPLDVSPEAEDMSTTGSH